MIHNTEFKSDVTYTVVINRDTMYDYFSLLKIFVEEKYSE